VLHSDNKFRSFHAVKENFPAYPAGQEYRDRPRQPTAPRITPLATRGTLGNRQKSLALARLRDESGSGTKKGRSDGALRPWNVAPVIGGRSVSCCPLRRNGRYGRPNVPMTAPGLAQRDLGRPSSVLPERVREPVWGRPLEPQVWELQVWELQV
jgi:hypothetical protein